MKLFKYLIIIIIGFSFFQGVANLVGIPSVPYEAIIDISVLTIFTASFLYRMNNDKRYSSHGLFIFLALSLIFLISGIVNNSSVYTSLTMYRNTFIPFLFFLSVLNLPFKEKHFQSVNKFILFMVIVQIIAAILKYMAWGVREDGIIGTFSESAGQMSTIFPLLVIIFLFLYYLINKKYFWPFLFISLGMIFMAWGGGKRAFIFVLPLFLILSYLTYNKIEKDYSIFSLVNSIKSVAITIIVIPIIYLLMINTPTLNPENKVGGTFDANHVYGYVTSYHIGGWTRGTLVAGRTATTKIALQYVTDTPKEMLLGYGPDTVYSASRGDEELVKFGVVSFMTGWSRYLMSIGFVGSLLIILLYIKIAYSCYRLYNKASAYWRSTILGIIVSIFVLLFDYFMYSPAFLHHYIPSIPFFYLSGAIINIYKNRIPNEKYVLNNDSTLY